MDAINEKRDRDMRRQVERNFGLLVHDVAILLEKHFNLLRRRLGREGLTRSQAHLLAVLAVRDGLTQTELGEHMSIEKAALGNLLDKLEHSGWIVRKPNPGDRRAKRVYLTAKIVEHAPQLEAMSVESHETALAGVGADERERLIDILLLTKRNLKRALEKH